MSNKSATTTVSAAQDASEIGVELGHGNTPAAWTCVGVMLIGTIIGCIAFVIGESATVLFWIGVGVIGLGLVLGLIMKKMGYGVGGSKLKNAGH